MWLPLGLFPHYCGFSFEAPVETVLSASLCWARMCNQFWPITCEWRDRHHFQALSLVVKVRSPSGLFLLCHETGTVLDSKSDNMELSSCQCSVIMEHKHKRDLCWFKHWGLRVICYCGKPWPNLHILKSAISNTICQNTNPKLNHPFPRKIPRRYSRILELKS